MKARPVKSVRCAIYTRVSTEQGPVFSGEKLDMHCPGRLGAGAFFVGPCHRAAAWRPCIIFTVAVLVAAGSSAHRRRPLRVRSGFAVAARFWQVPRYYRGLSTCVSRCWRYYLRQSVSKPKLRRHR
jgi:hypothetical protein